MNTLDFSMSQTFPHIHSKRIDGLLSGSYIHQHLQKSINLGKVPLLNKLSYRAQIGRVQKSSLKWDKSRYCNFFVEERILAELILFCRVLRDSTPRFVRRSVVFFMFFILWPYCSCPNALVTSNMAPAHPHATGVAVNPALFFPMLIYLWTTNY